MGERPRSHTLDRIDSEGDYEKSNWQWTTDHEQARNKKQSIIIEYQGATRSLNQWALVLGFHYGTLWKRYQRGLRGAKLFCKPLPRSRW